MSKIKSMVSLRVHLPNSQHFLFTQRGAKISQDDTKTPSPRASYHKLILAQKGNCHKRASHTLLGVLFSIVIMVISLPPFFSVECVEASALSSIGEQKRIQLSPSSQTTPSTQPTKIAGAPRVYRHWVINPERLGEVDPDWEASFRNEAQRALADGRWATALHQEAQALQAYAHAPHGRTLPMSLKTFTWQAKTPLAIALEKREKQKGRISTQSNETPLAPFSPAVTAALAQLTRTYLFFDAESVAQRAFVRTAVLDANRRAQPLTLLAINGTMRDAQRALPSTSTSMTDMSVSAQAGHNASRADRQQEHSDLTTDPSITLTSVMPTTVYFDQYGVLSQKLSVTHLPALVRLTAKTIDGLTLALTPDGEPMDPEALHAFWNEKKERSK